MNTDSRPRTLGVMLGAPLLAAVWALAACSPESEPRTNSSIGPSTDSSAATSQSSATTQLSETTIATVVPDPSDVTESTDTSTADPDVDVRDKIGPRAYEDETVVVVDSLRRAADGPMTMRMRVANARDAPLVVGSSGNEGAPLVVIRDDRANVYESVAVEPIEIPAMTVAQIDVAFDEPVATDADDITIELNTERATLTTDPIPIPQDRSVRWRTGAPSIAFDDLVARDDTNRVVQIFGVVDRGTHLDVSFLATDSWTGYSGLNSVYGDLRLPDGTTSESTGERDTEIQRFHPIRGVMRFPTPVPADAQRVNVEILQVPVDVPLDPSQPSRVANALPAAVELDLSADHPNGMSITLDRATFLDAHIAVDATVSTGSIGSDLNRLGGSRLVDDLGGMYPMSTGAADGDLTIPVDTEAKVWLVFTGRVDPAASSLQLTVNEEYGEDAADTDTPLVAFEAFEVPAQDDAGSEPTTIEAPLAALPDADVTDVAVDLVPLPVSEVAIDPQVIAQLIGSESTASPEEIDAHTVAESQESLDTLDAERSADGLVVTIDETVLFEPESSELLPAADDALESVVAALDGYPNASIEIAGHTDPLGTDEYNQTLSEDRAAAVADRLVELGVDETQLTVVGYGETRPIAANVDQTGSDDPVGRSRNRRVEIVVTA